MIPVFIYGKNTDNNISFKLREVLTKNGGVLHINENNIAVEPSYKLPHFFLYEFEKAPIFEMKNAIIIFKNEIEHFDELIIPPTFLAIVDSENHQALTLIKKLQIPAITCGISASNTFSISSISENTASISLQRDVLNIKGEIVEAREIPVKLTAETEEFIILAVSAVFLLSDRFNDEITI